MYGEVPPVGSAVSPPFAPPLHDTLESFLTVADNPGPAGSLIVAVSVSEHPLPSVMVIVYVPAINPVIEAVVAKIAELVEVDQA